MAEQKGMFPIRGTMGEVNFYRGQDGFRLRPKGGVTGERIAKDPAFQRTRENGAEFGRAAKGGKLIRNSMNILVQAIADNRIIGRLQAAVLKCIQGDTTHDRGQRTVMAGDATLLQEFDFNRNSPLLTVFHVTILPTITRSTGTLEITVPPFTPLEHVIAPPGATHLRLVAASSAIDFDLETNTGIQDHSGFVPLNNQVVPAMVLNCNQAANSTDVLLLAFGIQFYQQMNGNQYPLKSGAFNALSIVKVDL